MYLGLAVSWGVGTWLSMRGDPSSLRMQLWVVVCLAAMLPAVVGGVIEDVSQRLSVRYRLVLTLLSAVLAGFLWGLPPAPPRRALVGAGPGSGLPRAGDGPGVPGPPGPPPSLQIHDRVK